jgi:hypothetical protein
MGRQASDVVYEGPDQYGQVHPVESCQLIATKILEMEKEVTKMSTSMKGCLLQAQQRCPELLTNDFKLMFLRCELFDAVNAAARYVLYWNKRVEIFGTELAFQPLTLSAMDAASDDAASDKVAREMGVFNIFEASGRIMAFEVIRRYSLNGTTRKSYLKAFWYFVHTALENEETQKRGIVIINLPDGVNIRKQQDLRMVRMATSLKGVLPLRLSAYHIVNPPSWLALFLPLLTLFLGERLRKRVLIHAGTREEGLERLSVYGLKRQELPREIGGGRTVDMAAFLAERKSAGL